uniref:Uncharacterized protein n=1 Tax=Moniliophthora roreri TaxID=221103 RepID=A0A0W0FW12_MONRR
MPLPSDFAVSPVPSDLNNFIPPWGVRSFAAPEVLALQSTPRPEYPPLPHLLPVPTLPTPGQGGRLSECCPKVDVVAQDVRGERRQTPSRMDCAAAERAIRSSDGAAPDGSVARAK